MYIILIEQATPLSYSSLAVDQFNRYELAPYTNKMLQKNTKLAIKLKVTKVIGITQYNTYMQAHKVTNHHPHIKHIT